MIYTEMSQILASAQWIFEIRNCMFFHMSSVFHKEKDKNFLYLDRKHHIAKIMFNQIAIFLLFTRISDCH